MAYLEEVYQPAYCQLEYVRTPDSWKESTLTRPSYDTKYIPLESSVLLLINMTGGPARPMKGRARRVRKARMVPYMARFTGRWAFLSFYTVRIDHRL